MIRGILQGKTAAQAARDAGYSEKSAKGTIYRLLKSTEIKEKSYEGFKSIRPRKEIEESSKSVSLNTDEIIGTLVTQMRGDLAFILPESPFLKRASERGVSHLIKRLKIKNTVIPREDGILIQEEIIGIEVYSSLQAATLLCKIFGLKNLPPPKPPYPKSQLEAEREFQSAVEDVMQSCRLAGITWPDEVLRKKIEQGLQPLRDFYGLEGLTPTNPVAEINSNPEALRGTEELSENSELNDNTHRGQCEEEESKVVVADQKTSIVTDGHPEFLENEASPVAEKLPQNSEPHDDANYASYVGDSWPALFDRLAQANTTVRMADQRSTEQRSTERFRRVATQRLNAFPLGSK